MMVAHDEIGTHGSKRFKMHFIKLILRSCGASNFQRLPVQGF